MEASHPVNPPGLLYQDQTLPPPLMHLPYEAPPQPTCPPPLPPLLFLTPPTFPITPHTTASPTLPTGGHWRTGDTQQGCTAPPPPPTWWVTSQPSPPTTPPTTSPPSI
ncbi:hypothetical protein NQZ68_017752 [Dissostichus eleginoides]|nr:hypothetical protein NQZ68_017752 [Dissostichus eleginoides]